jgi:hypothetical protein
MLKPSTAVIAVDGVLRHPVSGTPIREGIKLYLTLADSYDIVIAADEDQGDELQDWLDRNGVRKRLGQVLWRRDGGRIAQLEFLRQGGGLIDLVVEPDPAAAAVAYQQGFTVLMFLSPAYSKPEWRPDDRPGIPAWDDLLERVSRDQDAWVNEGRLN